MVAVFGQYVRLNMENQDPHRGFAGEALTGCQKRVGGPNFESKCPSPPSVSLVC